VDEWKFAVVLFVALSLTAVSAFAQHSYYVRTVRRLARAHNRPGCVLLSGRAKSRLRGAIAVLVLRTTDGVIEAASVMEGSSVLARFRDRPDWVGLAATAYRPPAMTKPRWRGFGGGRACCRRCW
jgi:glucitol operon activator protein